MSWKANGDNTVGLLAVRRDNKLARLIQVPDVREIDLIVGRATKVVSAGEEVVSKNSSR